MEILLTQLPGGEERARTPRIEQEGKCRTAIKGKTSKAEAKGDLKMRKQKEKVPAARCPGIDDRVQLCRALLHPLVPAHPSLPQPELTGPGQSGKSPVLIQENG